MATDDLTLARTYRAAGIAAMATGDYATAVQQFLAAKAVLSTMPAHVQRGGGLGGGMQNLNVDANALDALIDRCILMDNAATGVQAANIVRQPPEDAA